MKAKHLLITLVVVAVLLLSSCGSRPRVGALQTESRSVEVKGAEQVRVRIDLGAGNLEVTGGADKLLEGDFTYNVAKLKPVVDYKKGQLVVRQPEVRGLPVLLGITDYRNEWDLRLNNQAPMELSVYMGGGTSDLRLSGLSLSRLDIHLGAGLSMIDLSGDWTRDLEATIDAGAANLNLRLPQNVGVRVEFDPGATMINAPGLTKNGNTYTNAAYGVSEVTVQVDLSTGIGLANLEVAEGEAAARSD